MPTGAGKSLVIAAIARYFSGVQVLILTPRRKLLQQARKKLSRHGVLSSSLGNDLGDAHRLIIGTFQTVMQRLDLQTPVVIIIDECHLVPTNSRYSQLLDRFPDAVVIGLTATPFRGRSHIHECGLRWKLIHSVSIKTLIELKSLVPPRSMSTPANVQTNGDDDPQRDAITELIVPVLAAAVTKEGRSKCLVFCADIAHAQLTVNLLKRFGEGQVFIVHSRQNKREQDAQFAAFEKDGGRKWLVNVGLVSLGVDIPAVDCIAILRDIGSFALLVQIIGRGLRLCDGKVDCLVYDFGMGTRRFGFVDDPQFGETRVGGASHHALKGCPGCGALLHISATSCARCDFHFPSSTTLQASATSTQLLSADYCHATYDRVNVSPLPPHQWFIEHQLTIQGRRVRALDVRNGHLPPIVTTPAQGDAVLIKRLEFDIVEMLGVAK